MDNSKKKKKTTNKVNNNDRTKKYEIKEEKNKKGKSSKKKHPKLKKVILALVMLIIIFCLICAGIVAGIFFSDKFKLTEEDLKITNVNGAIKDKDGVVIATLSGDENRKIVTFDNMPTYLPKAFIAIEDKRFYEHSGVDLKRTLYATAMYAVNKGDSSAGGGSTITQQLVKNLMNDKDDAGAKGVERKIREMARAYNVEKILSKDQILELYLNKIFMGSTVYGVGMASEYYFNKPVADLDLAECAFLAGINHTPNSYNPFEEEDHSQIIKKRTKEVLYQMKEQGYVTNEEEYNAAVEKVENGLPFSKGDVSSKATYSYHTAAAIKEVIEDIAKEKDISEDAAEFMLYNKGYTIYTTQDTAIQKRMEEEFVKDKYLVKGREKKKDGTLLNTGHTQAAMVIMDQKTGQVVATMGGLGSDSSSTGYNRAIQGTKQPGSSIKPIGVVAPALEKGIITAGTVYDDSQTTFSGNYTPHNSDYGFDGLLTVRHGIEVSSNIVNMKIMAELGAKNSAEFLKQMGLTKISNDDIGLSLALGATSTTPLEMAGAYAAVANGGQYIEPTFYTKVEDSNGNVVLETKQETRRVMSEANAFILESILTTPVTGNGGTATTCSISGMSVGAKTGSTDGYKDRWLCGITPYYTAATWFGFDNAERPQGISGNGAAKLWSAIMRDVHKSLPKKTFTKPSNVVSIRICLDSGCVATESCSRTESEYFVKGKTPGQCQGHAKLKICKQTGKIANEFCTDVEEKTFLVKPAKENTKLWSTNAGDKYNVPTETCDVHKKPEEQKVTVTNVVGKTLAEAKKELEHLGLIVEVEYKVDNSKKEGTVIRQSVAKDTSVNKGSKITIVISKKEEKKPENVENKIENNITPTTNEI